MFTQIQTILSSIINYDNDIMMDEAPDIKICPSLLDFTPKMKKYIETMGYFKLMKIINLINNQNNNDDNDDDDNNDDNNDNDDNNYNDIDEFAVFRQSFVDNKFEFITNVVTDKKNTQHIYDFEINIQDTGLILNSRSALSMGNYIYSNQHNRYLFLPFTYCCYLTENGHLCVIVVDNLYKKVYIVDPNGALSYFNNLLGTNIDSSIELLIKQYFDYVSINYFKPINYEYIPLNVWNNKPICLNYHFGSSDITDGHCVVVTLIICHVITLNDSTISTAMEHLNSLSKSELFYILLSYSKGVYNILVNND